ncbi:MAG TPA: hemerythrin domain-containing protein [Leptospiraceae bacterium]|nr:hemerythrin domain-containing protein [Leptospiraceae bacterium]HNB97466.1 hemerythrin domain-containing protein [Leptospiraceae bacterium]HNE11724.1 hemerythrin domain-containing protein [Leptospiraceae bacterium]HNE56766.1 hemerythrin domain-containing protein [Leptospiraceae bacterium]HNH03055.1 hemerythrin domain-containing protein [Leptospiraceae bacterium]
MAMTDSYRKQHTELLEMATQLSTKLSVDIITKEANQIVTILSQFGSKLNMHLTMEDKALYPKLINSGNAKTAQIANEYITEMGGIKQVVEKYLTSWSLAKNLIAQPQKFIDESKGIITALKGRINKENNTLYPLADAL